MAERPKAKNSEAEKEIEKAEKQFEAFEQNISDLTHDRLAAAPKLDVEPQTKLSQRERDRLPDMYIKPIRSYPSKEKFNERFRDEYNFMKEYVQSECENRESPGSVIETTIKPYPGCPAEDWRIPVNKPVWIPRYVDERINGSTYSRLEMNGDKEAENASGKTVQTVEWQGKMVVDRKVPRLLSLPVNTRRHIYMGNTR